MTKNQSFRFTILVFIVISVFSNAVAQDPQFSQFYANPLYTNPAFAGSEICPRIVMNYRNQWSALPGGFTTYSISGDQYVDFLKGGLGLQVYQDNAGNGTIKTFNASLSYAYTLKLNNQLALKFGAEAAYWQKSLEWDDLTFGDMIDDRYGFIYSTNEPFGDAKVNAPDFSAGLLLYSKNWYFGGAVHHLAEPVESFFALDDAVLYRRYTVQAGATIALDKRHPEAGSISPSVIYMQQGPSQQFNLGLYGRMSVFTVGFWYRFNQYNGDALIALIGLQNDKFKFGYSYDITVSKLTNATGGSHELSLGFNLPCKVKRPKYSPPPCPQW
jgi:type IX secretion system PorP/SprF family membrane protein